jgi:hypothetical protein
MKTNLKLTTLAALAALMAVPAASFAADRDRGHRVEVRNEWKAAGIGSALLGVAGILTHNDGLAVAGTLGAIYSGIRADDNCAPSYGYGNGYGYGYSAPVYVSRDRDQNRRRDDYRRNDNRRDDNRRNDNRRDDSRGRSDRRR